MINRPNIDPESPAPRTNPTENTQQKKGGGSFHFTKGQTFLGMQFSPEEWTKLMNIMIQVVNTQIQKEQAKAIKAIRKLRKSESGQDTDDD